MQKTAVINIEPEDVASMTQHWLGCQAGAYLGQDYGNDVKALLQTPLAAGLANDTIAKLRADIPLIGASGPNEVNVYALQTGIDSMAVVFDVYGVPVQAGG